MLVVRGVGRVGVLVAGQPRATLTQGRAVHGPQADAGLDRAWGQDQAVVLGVGEAVAVLVVAAADLVAGQRLGGADYAVPVVVALAHAARAGAGAAGLADAAGLRAVEEGDDEVLVGEAVAVVVFAVTCQLEVRLVGRVVGQVARRVAVQPGPPHAQGGGARRPGADALGEAAGPCVVDQELVVLGVGEAVAVVVEAVADLHGRHTLGGALAGALVCGAAGQAVGAGPEPAGLAHT